MKLAQSSAFPSVRPPASTASPLQNDLLAALTPEVQKRLFPFLELYPLRLGKVLYKSGDTLNYAYFPTDAIVSLFYVLQDGASTEVSIVGKNGFIGIGLVMGGNSTPWISAVQSQGNAYRLPAKVLRDEFIRHGELLPVLLRYSQTLLTQIAQIAVCNRHHTIMQQLCRWLLLSLDVLPDANMNVTQELIANMLGVRRESVTDAAGKLQKLGVINYRRGQIKILDRAGLERHSCECYRVVKSENERVMNCMPRSSLLSMN
jgi:CRP-like cAMP-binding protein